MLQDADNHAYVESLWVSDEELAPILREIDNAGKNNPRVKRRRYQRRTYRVDGGIQFEVRPPYERPLYFVVRPYDLCEQGAGLLHGGPLSPGIRCLLTLISGTGQRITVEGVVSHCRRVRGRIHYIGMSFNETLPVDRFCDSSGDGPQARRQPHSYDGVKLVGLARELIRLIESQAPVHQVKLVIGNMARVTETGLVINTQSLRPDWRNKPKVARNRSAESPETKPDESGD